MNRKRFWQAIAALVLVVLSPTVGIDGLPQASEVTLTATDNTDGTLTASYSSFSGFASVAVALGIEDCNEAIMAVSSGASFFDVIRSVDSNTGEVLEFGLMSTLSGQGVFPPAVPELLTIDFGGPAAGTLVPDMNRGGIVDSSDGEPVQSLPLPFTVTMQCACLGDLSDSSGVSDTGDGVIDLGDYNSFFSYLSNFPPDYTINPVPRAVLGGWTWATLITF